MEVIETKGMVKMRFGDSIRFRVIIMLIIITVPMAAFLLFNNFYSMRVVRDQVVKAHSDMLPMYVKQIDTILDELTNNLNYLINQDTDVAVFGTLPEGDVDYAVSVQRLLAKLNNETLLHEYVHTMFAYSTKYDQLLVSKSGRKNYDSYSKTIREKLPFLISSLHKNKSLKWLVVQSEEGDGLVKVITDNTGTYLGTWVNVELLVNKDDRKKNRDENTLVYTLDGQLLSNNGDSYENLEINRDSLEEISRHYKILRDETGRSRYLLVGSQSERADIVFVAISPEQSILEALPVLQLMIFFIPVAILLVFSTYLFSIQGLFLKPVQELLKGMRKIAQGELDVNLKEKGAGEFRFLIHSFNDMVQQIRKLKIDIYEEQLQVQRAELKHLQVQINPHFYSNSLYVIYNLAALKDYKTVQKMALYLAGYFRYIMNTKNALITLKEEASHVENYLEIQKLRFPERITYEFTIAEECERCLLPPLTIQPFIENSVLHGFKNQDGIFHIVLQAALQRQAEETFMEITVEDNGCGFSEEKLAELQSERYLDIHGDRHVGIWNVRRRLRMNFGQKAGMQFENSTQGGAAVKMRLPVVYDEKQKGDQAYV